MLTIALPKEKRMREAALALRGIGLPAPDPVESDESRRLLHASPDGRYRFLILRGADVPTFVEHGCAEFGIVGKDVLLNGEKRVYELLDLGFAACRFVVAAPRTEVERARRAGAQTAVAVLDQLGAGRSHLRIATKFPRIAERWFQGSRRPVDIIPLHGNVELAPQVGLAEAILDLVETGRTLRENGLVEVAEVARSTARLIANGAALRLQRTRIDEVVGRLRVLTGAGGVDGHAHSG